MQLKMKPNMYCLITNKDSKRGDAAPLKSLFYGGRVHCFSKRNALMVRQYEDIIILPSSNNILCGCYVSFHLYEN